MKKATQGISGQAGRKSISSIRNPDFNQDGFEIHDVFSEHELGDIGVDFHNRLLLQAHKLGLVEKFAFLEYGSRLAAEKMDDLAAAVHQKNKRSLDFAVQELRECPSFYRLVNNRFLETSSRILNCPSSLLKIHFDGILVNIPSNKQRLYRFHSEAHYYPYRKNFLNFWMPVIRKKTSDNGAMFIKHKGHLRTYTFNEYSGFDEVEGSDANEEDFLYQLELPEHEIRGLDDVVADLDVGKGLFFHSNLPHTSVLNTSTEPSYALIARVYDYRKDLTLSDRTGIKLYNGAGGGYPGLKPVL